MNIDRRSKEEQDRYGYGYETEWEVKDEYGQDLKRGRLGMDMDMGQKEKQERYGYGQEGEEGV